MASEPTSSEAVPARKFQFCGGNLCLDFTNTVGGKRGAVSRELLNSYGDLLSWCQQAEIIDETQTRKLAQRAVHEPAEAAAVLVRAIELREAIYRVFAALNGGRHPARTDLDCLNAELARALCQMRVTAKADGFVWTWALEPELGAPLGPVARAAADLLTTERSVHQVHQCGGDNCGWLFLDTSKNHSRRWCDMRDCGNRAKVRRHRARARGKGGHPGAG